MNELHLQDKFLIPFFTATDGSGLGYKEVKANTIDANSLICESDLCEFLRTSKVNKENYKKLLKRFKNKEDELAKELIEFLLVKMKDFRNMALFLNHNNSSFTFEGFKFYLFNRSDSQTSGDDDFNENIFSVVPELTYKYYYKGKRIFWFRPDISLFVNGIYLGYCELKSNYTNQSAKKDGKKKIRKDYNEAVVSYLENIESDDKYLEECLLEFFRKYNDIYNAINKPDDIDEVNIYFDDQIGIVEVSKIKEIKPHTPPTSGGEGTSGGKTYKYKILEIIEKRNEEEANIGKLIEEFEALIKTFFEYVQSHKEFNDLKAKMKGTQFSEDEIYNDFRKIYNSFLRRKKGDEWNFFKKNTKDLVEKLCDDFEEIIKC